LFLDVPPVDRAPGYLSWASLLAPAIKDWNAQLAAYATAFSNNRTDAAVFLYSANDQFSWLLDNAQALGYLWASRSSMSSL
jgi:hypothetical protein